MLASIFLGVHRCCRSRIVVPDSSSFPPSSQWCSCIDCLYSPIGIQYRIASRPLLSVYNALHTIRKSLSSLGQDRESLQHRGVSGCYYFKNWGSPRSLLEYFAIMRTFGIDTPFTSCIQRIETGLWSLRRSDVTWRTSQERQSRPREVFWRIHISKYKFASPLDSVFAMINVLKEERLRTNERRLSRFQNRNSNIQKIERAGEALIYAIYDSHGIEGDRRK